MMYKNNHPNAKPKFASKEELYKDYVMDGMSYSEVAKKYRVTATRVRRLLKLFKIKAREKYKLKDMLGKRFDRLLVVRYVPIYERKNIKSTRAHWECLCDCGNRIIIATTSLNKKLTKSCGCLKKELSWNGEGELCGVYVHRIKLGAKKRNLEYKLSNQYLWNLFLTQDRRCALSGIKLEMKSDYTRNFKLHTASLDRINNDKGYVEGNVRWVHKRLNMMRTNMTDSDFIFFCKAVGDYNAVSNKDKYKLMIDQIRGIVGY